MNTARLAIRGGGVVTAALMLGACVDDVETEVVDTGIELPGTGSDDGLDGSSGGSDDTDDDTPGHCGTSTFVLEHQPTNVMLVLDKSYSMVANSWDHDADPATPPITRWSSLHRSVSFIVQELDDGLDFGAVLFPAIDVPDNGWETACMVASEPDAPVAPHNAAAVLAALPAADELELFGGTPASAGIQTSLDHLGGLDPQVPRAMILVTDGAANCLEGTTHGAVFDRYDEDLPVLVADAYAAGVPTFVVGIDIVDGIADYPQDNPFERLNEVAIAGGYPRAGAEKFHNALDEDELRAAIGQVTGQIGCTIPLEMAPERPDLLSIELGGERIPRVASCDGAEQGWSYPHPTGPYDEIELCGDTCNTLHELGTLSAQYECIPAG